MELSDRRLPGFAPVELLLESLVAAARWLLAMRRGCLRSCVLQFGLTAVAVSLLGSPVGAETAKKVLMIGIDGAGGRYVPLANTPNLDALAAAGAVRYDFLNEGALTPDPPDGYGASGVNWSTILTGASAAHHGVVDNSFAGANFADYPHFFQHVKQFDSSLYTASFANWSPINTFITPNEFADVEFGFDSGTVAAQDVGVKNAAVALLGSGNPTAIFLHFDQVDDAGHTFSWGSAQHLAAIETVDGLIGQIMTALNNRPGVASGDEDWLVLVTADHGAAFGAYGHFAGQGPENWEVPFYVSGPSVPDGVTMQRGTLRDLAATALWHLGIDPFLAGLDGTVRGLPIMPPNGVAGDLNGDGELLGNGNGPADVDDVTAFLDHWLVAGGGGIPERYARGDLNLDGITDLSDWALLNSLNPTMGQAIALHLGGSIPEPTMWTLSMFSAAWFTCTARRHGNLP